MKAVNHTAVMGQESLACSQGRNWVFVQEKAQNIHARLKRTAEDIIVIGQDLMAVKDKLPYGHFVPWLQSEFEMTPRSAQRFMQVAEKFGSRNDNLSFLPASVLYELASPSTPETIVEMVETGQIPATLPAIREAKQELIQVTQYKKKHCSLIFQSVNRERFSSSWPGAQVFH